MLRRPLLALLLRLAEPPAAQRTAADPTGPPAGSFDPITLPPSSEVSPEEEMEMWDSPPVALAKKKVILKVQSDGSLPEALEQIRLTRAGKVLAHSDFIIEDDFGVQGQSGETPGQCQFCSRYAFRAQPCAACGLVACPGCGAPTLVDGQPVVLCKPCERATEWQRDNWQL